MSQPPQKVYADAFGVIPIDAANRLGSGGFATVFAYKDLAIKILNNPDPDTIRHLQYLVTHVNAQVLPVEVLMVLSLIRTRQNGEFLGTVMKKLPVEAKAVSVLFNRNLKRKLGVTTKLISELFLNGFKTLIVVHKNGLVVMDLSARNILFTLDGKMHWIDVDSWYIPAEGNLKQIVCTEEFVDPLLIDPKTGARVNTQTLPTPGNDIYSLDVSLFHSMLGYHPYGGTHAVYGDDFGERIQRGLWALDKGVTINPDIGLNPEIFSDELLHHFEGVFVHKKRDEYPQTLLQNHIDHLVKCTKCDAWYPDNRKACPACSAKSEVTVPAKPEITMQILSLVQTNGSVEFVRFRKGKLYAVVYEGRKVVLYIKGPQGAPDRKIICDIAPDMRFDLAGENRLITNTPPSLDLQMWDISQTPVRLVETTASEPFLGNQSYAVFRGGPTGLIRIAGKTLMTGTIKLGIAAEEALPVLASQNQTWFWADPDHNRIFGMFQYPQVQFYWFIDEKQRYEVDIPQLAIGDVLLDTSVRFGHHSILMRRLYQRGSRTYLQILVIDLKGKVIFSPKVTEARKHPFPQIRGDGYSDVGDVWTVWHQTDKGLVAERLQTNTFDPVKSTVNYVRSSDRVVHLKDERHFLVIRDRKVDYLVLK